MRKLTIIPIEINFKENFVHHTASREKTETLLLQITNGDGAVGYGESCPRSYVTGESLPSAMAFVESHECKLSAIQNLLALTNFMELNQREIDKNPAAWCAIEMALLDLMGQESKKSVEEFLGIKTPQSSSKYTAVIGVTSPLKFLKKALLYRALGFKDFKIKLSGIHSQDEKSLKILWALGVQTRIDGNNIFENLEQALTYLTPLKNYIWAIEEPLLPNMYKDLVELSETLNVKIILDESFINIDTLKRIQDHPSVFIPNLRISKLGGVLRTLAIMDALKKNHIQWILGSHVGEMSLLARAALLVGRIHPENLIAKEGGFSTHLLKIDPFTPNLILGVGAKMTHKTPDQLAGWGMTFTGET